MLNSAASLPPLPLTFNDQIPFEKAHSFGHHVAAWLSLLNQNFVLVLPPPQAILNHRACISTKVLPTSVQLKILISSWGSSSVPPWFFTFYDACELLMTFAIRRGPFTNTLEFSPSFIFDPAIVLIQGLFLSFGST